MASSSTESAGTSEDITLCSICVEKFKTPRFLPCMHSFCHNCLSSYIESSCKSTEHCLGFNCPLCRGYVPNNGAFDKPEEWARNFPVNDFLESILEKPDERLCAACLRDNENESATGFCLSCMEYLCSVCTKYHKKHLLSRDHTVCKMDEIKCTKMREFGKYFRCTEHNKAISLFCNDHEQPCCFICTGTCGAKHRECKSIDSIQKAASTVKESGKLDSLLNEVRIIEKKLKDAKREQEKNISELEDSVDKMTKESEKEFKELVDHIENLKNKHADELAVAQKKGRQEMDQCTRTLNDGMSCVNYCYQNVGKARETENENEILMNYYTAKETASQLNQFSFTKKHIKISLKKASILKNLKVAKSILDIKCSESKHHVLLSVSALALPRAPAFSIKEKDALIYTASFLANGTFAIIDHRVDGSCLIYDNKWAKTKVIEDLNRPFEVAQNLGELYVTCEGTKSIEVFSANDFHRLRTIPINESVYGIKIWNGAFYVACATKILKTDLSGNKIKEFKTEGKNNICILVTNNGLIVYSNWVLNTVTALTEQGDIAWKYEHLSMKQPCELDKDSVGNVVVAAKESNNIHVLSSAGDLIKVFENIPKPIFLKIDENRNICCVCNRHNVVNIYRI